MGIADQPLQVNVPRIPRILAVDDNRDSLILIAQVLDSLNCVYALATTGKRALEIARDYQPDTILLDIVLPDFSGLELLTRLRCETCTRDIR
ncbi:MAG: response regulator, partial [Spirulinaceae cyanobacterium RM2_2_10]|nr:response regulator [Spirulinaceae cyanobacterium RM2_2_10]